MVLIMNDFLLLLLGINLFLSAIIIFRERRQTAQTWAWLLVLLFIPILGFLLYMFFGRGISKEKIFDLKFQGKLGKNVEIDEQKEALLNHLYPNPATGQVEVKELVYMLTVFNRNLYTADNELTLFTDGQEKFASLLADIKDAQEHIHFEYYIYRSDSLGLKVKEALIEAAQRGVRVRVLLDAWGSNRVGRSFFADLKQAGGQVVFFFPLFLPYITPRLNYRNHRKIVVIDGTIGYIGGFNVGNEYLGLSQKFGYWRDNHLRIVGSAVYSLQNRFLMDWNSQNREVVTYQPQFFPKIISSGKVALQVVTSGPDSEREQIKMTYLKMINLAKEEILIQTPYYIPDEAIHEALRLALLSGVRVQLQIPNKPDHPLVYWATYSFAAELLKLGAQVDIYETGFIHAKTVIIDGGIVSVGSANIDVRSFKLDFEVNTVIYDRDFAQQVRQAFLQDAKHASQLTQKLYQQRGLRIKLKEGVARLVSPLL
ncbi:MAG: cardiolipin synthase [Enterococcus sp.]